MRKVVDECGRVTSACSVKTLKLASREKVDLLSVSKLDKQSDTWGACMGSRFFHAQTHFLKEVRYQAE